MLHEVKFHSFNQRDTVYGWIYVPACRPKGIIQLIHGFGEHSHRYLHMITSFMEAAYIVAADDHVGHGKTALENDNWGNWGDKSFNTMMEDEKKLHDLVIEKYPDLPYFMFGHSMGSFITRQYIAIVQKLVDEGKGDEADPSLGGTFMGWMFARCKEGVRLGNEWICDDVYLRLSVPLCVPHIRIS